MSTDDRKFSFHVEGPLAAGHSVPAAVLVKILENAQRAIELIGLQLGGKVVKTRIRSSRASIEKFQLVCKIPVHGCYAMPVEVGDINNLLFVNSQAEKAATIFKDLLASLDSVNSSRMIELLPDLAFRKRVLTSVKNMLPPAGADWHIEFYDDAELKFASLDEKSVNVIDRVLVPPTSRQAEQTITGTVAAIDFSFFKFTLEYPVTGKILTCHYDDEFEEILLDRKRELVHVTGEMELDDNGIPKGVRYVSAIDKVDLSEFVVHSVSRGDSTLVATSPLRFLPEFETSSQYMFIHNSSLGIDVYAETREKLAVELSEQVFMLWDEYAQAADEALDAKAVILKYSLLQSFGLEVRHAT